MTLESKTCSQLLERLTTLRTGTLLVSTPLILVNNLFCQVTKEVSHSRQDTRPSIDEEVDLLTTGV